MMKFSLMFRVIVCDGKVSYLPYENFKLNYRWSQKIYDQLIPYNQVLSNISLIGGSINVFLVHFIAESKRIGQKFNTINTKNNIESPNVLLSWMISINIPIAQMCRERKYNRVLNLKYFWNRPIEYRSLFKCDVGKITNFSFELISTSNESSFAFPSLI